MPKRKRRKTKRNELTQRDGPIPGVLHRKEIKGWSVNAWCPDLEAKVPPEQVHFVLEVEGAVHSNVLRFKSPDTIGDLIDLLTEYRRYVWPDAAPVSGESVAEEK